MTLIFNILDVISELTLSRVMNKSKAFCPKSFSLLDSLLDASTDDNYEYIMERYFDLITVQTPTKELANIQKATKDCEMQFYFLTWGKEHSYSYRHANLSTTFDVVNENAFIVLIRQDGVRVLTLD